MAMNHNRIDGLNTMTGSNEEAENLLSDLREAAPGWSHTVPAWREVMAQIHNHKVARAQAIQKGTFEGEGLDQYGGAYDDTSPATEGPYSFDDFPHSILHLEGEDGEANVAFFTSNRKADAVLFAGGLEMRRTLEALLVDNALFWSDKDAWSELVGRARRAVDDATWPKATPAAEAAPAPEPASLFTVRVPAQFEFQVVAKNEAEAFKMAHQGLAGVKPDSFNDLGEITFGSDDFPDGATLGDNRMVLDDKAADRAFIKEATVIVPAKPTE